MLFVRPAQVVLASIALAFVTTPVQAAPTAAAPAMQAAQVRSTMLARMKTTKKKADPAALASIFVAGPTPRIKTKSGRTYALEPVAATAPTPTASSEPTEIAKYKAYYDAPSAEPTVGATAVAVMRDHTSQQTPVKDQRSRGTCMAFATVATMESTLRRDKNIVADISEEHFYKIVKDSVQKDCNSDGTTFTGILNALAGKRVCAETDLPYAAPSSCTVPPACSGGAVFSLARTVFVPREPETGGSGFYANNARLIEAFIDMGYDVAIGFHIAGTGWRDDADAGVIDVQLKADGSPADSYGSHGVALVGYNRPGGYFIFKNSWGADWGRSGYARISYDYLQTYSKDAVIVLETGKALGSPVQAQSTQPPAAKAASKATNITAR